METWKKIIWSQFGAAIDMLENSITACPGEIWDDGTRDFSSYWYMVSRQKRDCKGACKKLDAEKSTLVGTRVSAFFFRYV